MKNWILIIMAAASMGINVRTAQAVPTGNDMWDGDYKTALYTPHKDNCHTTEVFIPMGNPADNHGYCIEKDQRNADTFENAKQTCDALGKRLPEPAEFKYACKLAPAGLNNMTDGWEWASNNVTHYPLNGGLLIGAYIAGYENCTWGAMNALSGNWNFSGSIQDNAQQFRCVR